MKSGAGSTASSGSTEQRGKSLKENPFQSRIVHPAKLTVSVKVEVDVSRAHGLSDLPSHPALGSHRGKRSLKEESSQERRHWTQEKGIRPRETLMGVGRGLELHRRLPVGAGQNVPEETHSRR